MIELLTDFVVIIACHLEHLFLLLSLNKDGKVPNFLTGMWMFYETNKTQNITVDLILKYKCDQIRLIHVEEAFKPTFCSYSDLDMFFLLKSFLINCKVPKGL